MDYRVNTISATEHQVTFADGRTVLFVMKEGDSLTEQIASYLSPPAFVPEVVVSDLDVFIKAVRDKIHLTDEELNQARAVLVAAES